MSLAWSGVPVCSLSETPRMTQTDARCVFWLLVGLGCLSCSRNCVLYWVLLKFEKEKKCTDFKWIVFFKLKLDANERSCGIQRWRKDNVVDILGKNKGKGNKQGLVQVHCRKSWQFWFWITQCLKLAYILFWSTNTKSYERKFTQSKVDLWPLIVSVII